MLQTSARVTGQWPHETSEISRHQLIVSVSVYNSCLQARTVSNKNKLACQVARQVESGQLGIFSSFTRSDCTTDFIWEARLETRLATAHIHFICLIDIVF